MVTMRIAVAGATGRVGRHVVEVLGTGGHDVVPISRSHGVDVISGEGLAQALKGVECVVDAATGPSPEQEAATKFFTTAAKNLQRTGERAGVQRMVVVSIINVDRLKGGYSIAKVAHEHAMLFRANSGSRGARRSVPRVCRAARAVGQARRCCLRADHAHAAGRRAHRGRSPRRAGGRSWLGARADPRGRRTTRGAPRRGCQAACRSPRRLAASGGGQRSGRRRGQRIRRPSARDARAARRPHLRGMAGFAYASMKPVAL